MLEIEYYTEDEVYDLMDRYGDDFEQLKEYLNGWDDAVTGKRMYSKKYVDMFINR